MYFELLDPCEEVTNLDASRCKLSVCGSAENKRCYDTALAKVQTKVLAANGQLKQVLKDWELTHVKQKGREPWGDDLRENPEMLMKYKAFQIAKELLKHWNITVHL